jgi:ABC-type phosphate/phosphonate transport system ATPase subunit
MANVAEQKQRSAKRKRNWSKKISVIEQAMVVVVAVEEPQNLNQLDNDNTLKKKLKKFKKENKMEIEEEVEE